MHEPREKIPYFVVIGCSTWNTYEVVRSDDDQTISQLGLPVQFLQSLTQLVLAWSYILCCRWVGMKKEIRRLERPRDVSTKNDDYNVEAKRRTNLH